ncbi:MAG: hypothetical protein WCA77_09445 [Thermoplasmata archaeon]
MLTWRVRQRKEDTEQIEELNPPASDGKSSTMEEKGSTPETASSGEETDGSENRDTLDDIF